MTNERTYPLLGLYMPDLRSATIQAGEYRQLLKQDIDVLSFYAAWGEADQGPDMEGLHEVVRRGFIPMITWEPWLLPELLGSNFPERQPDFSLAVILSGRYDDYIRRWAHELRELQGEVFFRPMHEMNGNWYPWCGSVNGNSPEDYRKAWRYIRSIFREAHADNLIWVWSPYAQSVPDEPDNRVGNYFPGAEEVDWLALDGYNWGTTREWSGWQGFDAVFEKGYGEFSRISRGHPFMIAEVGCAEEGGDKGQWIKAAWDALKGRFPRVRSLVWFNVDKECDWRIESSSGSLQAFVSNWRRSLA